VNHQVYAPLMRGLRAQHHWVPIVAADVDRHLARFQSILQAHAMSCRGDVFVAPLPTLDSQVPLCRLAADGNLNVP
jgi:hypothetical protein